MEVRVWDMMIMMLCCTITHVRDSSPQAAHLASGKVDVFNPLVRVPCKRQ